MIILDQMDKYPRLDMILNLFVSALLLNSACLVEKQQIPILNIWPDWTEARTDDLPHSIRKR